MAQTQKHKERGFTTIELSLVLIIFGMIMSTVMFGISVYLKQQTLVNTSDSLDNTQSAILEYVSNFQVYPCPADPTLPPTDPMYGREQRAIPNNNASPCIFPAAAVPGIDTADPGNAPDGVLIGGVPFVTIAENLSTIVQYADFSEEKAFDGWGRQLKYAVTQSMTVLGFNQLLGAIDVRDEGDNSLLDETEDLNNDSILNPGEDLNGNGNLDFGRYAHFVLISPGDNGRGGFTKQGQLVEPCPAALPLALAPEIASPRSELDNCNNLDGTFVSGIRIERDHSYNDDTLRFSFVQNSDLWRLVTQTQIQNTNPGNVGVGTDQPQQMLHVRENINVLQGTRALNYTDRVGASPMPSAALGGSAVAGVSAAMQCPAGQVITSIAGNTVTCAAPFGAAAPADQLCPLTGGGVQMAMYGIANVGGVPVIQCCDPATIGSCP